MGKTSIVPAQMKPAEVTFIAPKRPSNPLNRWIKESKNSYRITRKDVAYIYRNVIFTKTFGELKEIMEDPLKHDKMPALVITIIASVLGDIARGNILNLTRMLQYIFPDNGGEYEEFISGGSDGYAQIEDLEATLRRLEGDDSIMIVDKLMAARTVTE